MRRFALVTTGLTATLVAILLVTFPTHGVSAQVAGFRVSFVNFSDSPIQISSGRVVGLSNPAGVAIEVTNTSNRPIREYVVSTYVFRSNGRAAGTWQTSNRQGVNPGVSASFLANLWSAALEPDSVVIFAVATTLTADDGTRWRRPPDALYRVKNEASRLVGRSLARKNGNAAPSPYAALFVGSRPPLTLVQTGDVCGFNNATDYCTHWRNDCVDTCKNGA